MSRKRRHGPPDRNRQSPRQYEAPRHVMPQGAVAVSERDNGNGGAAVVVMRDGDGRPYVTLADSAGRGGYGASTAYAQGARQAQTATAQAAQAMQATAPNGGTGFAAKPYPDMPKVSDAKPLLQSLGATGTAIFSGIITSEEYNEDFYWKDAIAVYEQMSRNDAQIYAIKQLLELPIRRAVWSIEPGGSTDDSPEAQARNEEIAAFVETCLFHEMRYTTSEDRTLTQKWDDILRHILMMLWFGFMAFEVNWRIEDGWTKWARWTPLLPRTVWRWWVGEDNELVGLQQWTFKNYSYQFVDIPADKLLLFVHQQQGNNYEGVSVLRSAYKHWYYKDNFYKIEAIDIERNAAEIPAIYLPEQFTDEDIANAQTIMANMRVNENMGVTMPPGWKIEYIRTYGRQTAGVQPSIAHHDNMIARNVLGQFINLGSQEVGSYALADAQRAMLLAALQAECEYIEDVINNDAIPRLVDYNFEGVENYPRLKASKLIAQDLDVISTALNKLTSAPSGPLIHGDPDLEDYLRDLYGLPKMPAGAVQGTNPTAPVTPERPETDTADETAGDDHADAESKDRQPTARQQGQSQAIANGASNVRNSAASGNPQSGAQPVQAADADAGAGIAEEARLLREALAAAYERDAVERGLVFFNPAHVPAGSPAGGEFAPKGGGAGGGGIGGSGSMRGRASGGTGRGSGRSGAVKGAKSEDDETKGLRSEAKALKAAHAIPREDIATLHNNQLRQQDDPTDPAEALTRNHGDYQALFHQLAHEPTGVTEAMAHHRNMPDDAAKLSRGSDRLEIARHIATQMAPAAERAELEKSLLREEISMRQEAKAEREATRMHRATRAAKSEEARNAKARQARVEGKAGAKAKTAEDTAASKAAKAPRAKKAAAQGEKREVTDEQFRAALVKAYSHNAEEPNGGWAAIRTVRADVMKETGLSAKAVDARIADEMHHSGMPGRPYDVHLEPNEDHPNPRGALIDPGERGSTTEYTMMHMSKADEGYAAAYHTMDANLHLTQLPHEAPSGTMNAGIRGVSREEHEARLAAKAEREAKAAKGTRPARGGKVSAKSEEEQAANRARYDSMHDKEENARSVSEANSRLGGAPHEQVAGRDVYNRIQEGKTEFRDVARAGRLLPQGASAEEHAQQDEEAVRRADLWLNHGPGRFAPFHEQAEARSFIASHQDDALRYRAQAELERQVAALRQENEALKVGGGRAKGAGKTGEESGAKASGRGAKASTRPEERLSSSRIPDEERQQWGSNGRVNAHARYNPYFVLRVYGAGQLRAAMRDASMEKLREGARVVNRRLAAMGVKYPRITGRTKADITDQIERAMIAHPSGPFDSGEYGDGQE